MTPMGRMARPDEIANVAEFYYQMRPVLSQALRSSLTVGSLLLVAICLMETSPHELYGPS